MIMLSSNIFLHRVHSINIGAVEKHSYFWLFLEGLFIKVWKELYEVGKRREMLSIAEHEKDWKPVCPTQRCFH